MKRTIYATAAVGVLLLGACTDKGAPGGQDGTSPLEPYLGHSPLVDGLSGMTMAHSAEQLDGEQKNELRQVEQKVADCMREQGFEYVPVSPEDVTDSAFDEANKLDPEQFAKKYGYGITTLAPGHGGPGKGGDDPNSKIRDGLSDKARKAYDKALYGDDVQMNADGGVVLRREGGPGEQGDQPVETETSGPGGCTGKAVEAVHGKPGPKGSPEDEFAALFEDLEALQTRFRGDDTVREAARAWSDCMAEAGYPGLRELSDAQQKVLDKASKGKPGGSGPVELSPTDAGPEVQAFERKIATADYQCQQADSAKVKEVAYGMEAEFLEDHRAELERFAESSNGGEFG